MDEIIRGGILYGEHPPSGLYFTVLLVITAENSLYEVGDGHGLQSPPLTTFPEAVLIGDQIRDQLLEEAFVGASYDEVDAEDNNGFHTHIVNTEGDVLAKIAIDAHDYRGETIH